MGRRTWFLLGVLMANFAVAPSAQAKGPGLDHTSLGGPGIEVPIRLANRYPYLLNEAAMGHLFEAARSSRFHSIRPVPVAELGPRYDLAYHFAFGDPLEVDLYPYASGGPLGYVAPGQFAAVPVGISGTDVRFRAKPGWWRYRPRLIEYLQKEGLPQRAKAAASSIQWPAWWVSVVLLLALAAATGIQLRRRFRSDGAPRAVMSE